MQASYQIVSENYRSIPLDSFRISCAKNKQWEGLVKRRRDHRESDASSPAHKISALRVTKPFPTTHYRDILYTGDHELRRGQ